MSDPTPEQRTRLQMDAYLAAGGGVVEDFQAVDFSAGRGLALREVPLPTGPWDYLLLVNRKALGVIEAKKEGTTLVRFALEQQPVLAPFANSVSERCQEWLNLIRDHIATSLSLEPDDFDYAPFSQKGGLGKAHQLFGGATGQPPRRTKPATCCLIHEQTKE